jgi:3-methyl-2-oxobutanoate hydroxymethyltransferase
MMAVTEPRKLLTLHRMREMHSAGEKVAMLTCYDTTFANVNCLC